MREKRILDTRISNAICSEIKYYHMYVETTKIVYSGNPSPKQHPFTGSTPSCISHFHMNKTLVHTKCSVKRPS